MLLQAKSGFQPKKAFILKYRTARCVYQPKVGTRNKNGRQSKAAASQKLLLAKRAQKVAARRKWVLAENSCQ